MKKPLTVLFILSILSCRVFANELNDISVIENEIFGIEYKDNTLSERINRLEEHLFGKHKTGQNVQRIKQIAETAGISLMPKPTAEQRKIAAADLEPEASNVSYPVIDMMEEKLFNKVNQGENVYKRVERLEKQAFGKTFDGDLSERTDKLKAAVLAVKPEKITYDENLREYRTNQYQYYDDNPLFPERPLLTKKSSAYTGGAAPLNKSYYNSFGNESNDFEFALNAAENLILGTTNKSDSVHERLSRLEKKIFKKTYSGDNLSRLDRIVSAAHAQKTGKVYSENKWSKYLSTGIQIGAIVLMIMAMIL